MKLEQQIKAFMHFKCLMPKSMRQELERLKKEYRRIVDTVDAFYALLGPRNWVFTGDLNLEKMTEIVSDSDPESAELRLIEYYQTPELISSLLLRLYRFSEMQPRIPLLEKALDDYEAGRFYSTVLVLLSVMDGFVNELDPGQRKGLHARKSEDMVAWDSVVGHHLGLRHAHKSFTKGYYKTSVDETTELARNGIMHGALLNYDNKVVATKAWNRLFAVADWADACGNRPVSTDPNPTLGQLIRQWYELQVERVRLRRWEPRVYGGESFDGATSDVHDVCTDYLVRWSKGQWGPMGQHFMQTGSKPTPIGQLANDAKLLYQEKKLENWEILQVRHEAPAVAFVDVKLTVNAEVCLAELRWVRCDGSGASVSEWHEGRWTLSPYAPRYFLNAGAS